MRLALPTEESNRTRWLFLKALAAIYAVAFLSLWTQLDGLVGSRGILPATQTLSIWTEYFPAPLRYWHFPTVFWLGAGDGFLRAVCGGGFVLSLAALAGLAQGPLFLLLWAAYLSLYNVCADFLGFQWDILLLETGFLAVFFAPWRLLPGYERERNPSMLCLWLLRCLLFRLMFSSGVVKLTCGDPTWWNLGALEYHYETQPLPTWIGWYAHQLPSWFQGTSVAVMFVVEILVPFFIFLPRRFRLAAFFPLVAFQLLIALTGNYCFFNLLTLALCLTLLDDRFLRRVFRRRAAAGPAPVPVPAPLPTRAAARRPHALAVGALATLVLPLNVLCVSEAFDLPQGLRKAIGSVQGWVDPLNVVSSYGLFRVMTTERREIVVEGSNDGRTWAAYEFRWKPGDPGRPPAFVAPHQPRLDWQMWFAVLGDYRSPRNRWFQDFLGRLLEGSPPVLGLLEKNPFPAAPPHYVRALVYDYHFTDLETHRRTGEWWRRELLGLYCPVAGRPPQ